MGHTVRVGWPVAAVVLGCVALGAGLQRVAGMGLGLVAAPTLSLVLGPLAGVVGAADLARVDQLHAAEHRIYSRAPSS